MISDILDLKQKTQALIQQDRRQKDALPDYSELLPEIAEQRKTKYLSDVTAETTRKLDSIKFETKLKSDKLKTELTKTKYPLEAVSFRNDELIQTVKQRAENLALFQKLDFNILNYLESAMNKKENDFLYSFQEALKLNPNIPNELHLDILKKYADYEKKSGITKMNLELQLAETFSNQIDTYIKIAEDSNPNDKMLLLYSDTEINNLTNEINNL